MSADEIAALSLTDVAAKIAAKELSAVEAVEADEASGFADWP